MNWVRCEINSYLYLKWIDRQILLTYRDGSIKYKIIRSEIYDFYKTFLIKNRGKKCEIKNWCWTPIKVWNISTIDWNKLFDEIEAGKISSNAYEYKFL